MLSYPDYYTLCRKKYKQGCGLKVNLYNYPLLYEELGESHKELITQVHDSVVSLFEDDSKVHRAAGRNSSNDVLKRLANPLEISGINELADAVFNGVPELFDTHIHVQRIYTYQTQLGFVPRISSWLWHVDNHPQEVYKAMVYLNDVTGDTAPFELLLDERGDPIVIPPSRVGPKQWGAHKWKDSRVPDSFIKQKVDEGGYEWTETGNAGKTIIFDNNCIHRANFATDQMRNVVVFQFKPIDRELKPYVDKRWTGSFKHQCVVKDPAEITPK